MPREERAEQLLDAALRLVAREGFAALTIDRVASEVGIAKSVPYAIFSTPDGLLDALLAREGQRAAALADDAVSELAGTDELAAGAARAITRFLEGVAQHPDTWRLVLRPPAGAPAAVQRLSLEGRERWWRRLEPLTARLLERAGLEGLDPELTAHLARGNAEYLALLMLENPEHFSRERIGQYATDLTARLAALAASPKRRHGRSM
jgi:AcrR family transcriptional regulator